MPTSAGCVEAFGDVDRTPKVPAVIFKESPARVKTSARHLVGGQAFGCIKCHTFGGKKAEGTQGIDMTLMPKRLKHDWFHAYIGRSTELRPGTRMPSVFRRAKACCRTFSAGRPTQIEAIWVYLLDGGKARAAGRPGGKHSIPLMPTTAAIRYRNFILGAGRASHRRRLPGEGQPGIRRQRDAAVNALAGLIHGRRPALERPGRGL